METKLISIPYGSIKSVAVVVALVLDTVFQFLMVRLKARCVSACCTPPTYFNSLWFD